MRLVSLDVLRGLTVFGMILVNAAAGLYWSVDAQVFPALLHVPWDGLTLADLVFPGFLMMVGVAIPFSMADAAPREGRVRRILARTFRLFLLGFLLSNLYWFRDFASGDWRLFGVLQRIGLVYGACALLFLALGSRARMALIVAILILYWPLALLPSPDGLATDISVRGHNFVAWLDRAVLGTHLYVQGPQGYDPEGILSTLPAIAHGLIGVAIGEMLKANAQGGGTRKLLMLGGAMLAAGLAWSLAFPIIKDIWSSSFVLVTCGLTTLALAGLHAWLDRGRAHGAATRGFVSVTTALGINAIAAYTLHMVTSGMVTWQLLLAPFAATRASLGDPVASLFPISLYMAFIWAAMAYLQRRKWIVKI